MFAFRQLKNMAESHGAFLEKYESVGPMKVVYSNFSWNHLPLWMPLVHFIDYYCYSMVTMTNDCIPGDWKLTEGIFTDRNGREVDPLTNTDSVDSYSIEIKEGISV